MPPTTTEQRIHRLNATLERMAHGLFHRKHRTDENPVKHRHYSRVARFLFSAFTILFLLFLAKALPLGWHRLHLRYEADNVATHSDRRSEADLESYLTGVANRYGFKPALLDEQCIRVSKSHNTDGDPVCEVRLDLKQPVNVFGLLRFHIPFKHRREAIIIPAADKPSAPKQLWEVPMQSEH